jgi:Uncharacterized conserved protein
MKHTTAKLTLCALFAALSAILSQIAIPIGPVPINLTHISILTAAGLLGWKYAALSQLAYVAMGAVGLPVFSNFSGGMHKIAGPTGGFIIGYIVCALVTAAIIDFGDNGRSRGGTPMKILLPAMAAGWILTYALGSLWFMAVMHASLSTALMTCVAPFLIGDAAKTAISAVLINRLRPIVKSKFKQTKS